MPSLWASTQESLTVNHSATDTPQNMGQAENSTCTRVPLLVSSAYDLAAGAAPLSFAVPFARGLLKRPFAVSLAEEPGLTIQAEPTALWPDKSVKWLLVEMLSPEIRSGTHDWTLLIDRAFQKQQQQGCDLTVSDQAISVDTGIARFRIDRQRVHPLARVLLAGKDVAEQPASEFDLEDAKGHVHEARVQDIYLQEHGLLRTTLALECHYPQLPHIQLRIRLSFYAGSGIVKASIAIQNRRRALHKKGLWDLGDAGSFLFRSLQWRLKLPAGAGRKLYVKTECAADPIEVDPACAEIFQASSGGEQWQSPNHVDATGKVSLPFRGYQGQLGEEQVSGLRAQPTFSMLGDAAALSVSVADFWQQFPKKISVEEGMLRIGLFPDQKESPHELQGGERKTHTVWLRYDALGSAAEGESVARKFDWTASPVTIYPASQWTEATGVFSMFQAAAQDTLPQVADMNGAAIGGSNSFFAKREVIDEYGWRNYGDLWADHEMRFYKGPPPIISHYNNQYDALQGAIIQMFRTCDPRWQDVWQPLAQHVIDIDIYHTVEDKAAYNGGYFWLTDHYVSAQTATHRTFSRKNTPDDGRPNGGGPGAEHNYTTGLLYYYYLTGNPEAREAVLTLARWVINMEDGQQNLIGIAQNSPTGLSTFCWDEQYTGPGRGAANSIDTLLNAWLLTQETVYLQQAEQLICRCVHPEQEIQRLDLLNTEHNWSYTLFLITLARYLDIKAEYGQRDAMYAYAQRSLLHYARWMLDEERIWLDDPDRLIYVTEAWATQEFRKVTAMRLAALHAADDFREALLQKANQFADRAWHDLFSYDSRYVTRSLVILMTEGPRDAYFRKQELPQIPALSGDYDFPPIHPFVPQRLLLSKQLFRLSGIVGLCLSLLNLQNWKRYWKARNEAAGSLRKVSVTGEKITTPDASQSLATKMKKNLG